MKKITYILAMVACIFLIAINPALAGNNTQTDGEGDLTVSDSTGLTGGDMVFTPSPSTTISCSTDANNYTIISGSTNNKADVGALYGIISSNSSVYKNALTADNTVVATSSTTTLTAGGNANWEDKNGNTP